MTMGSEQYHLPQA